MFSDSCIIPSLLGLPEREQPLFVLSEGQVRLLHEQNELNEALSFSFKFQPIIAESAHFFTATILEWEKLLEAEKYKDIIISSLHIRGL